MWPSMCSACRDRIEGRSLPSMTILSSVSFAPFVFEQR